MQLTADIDLTSQDIAGLASPDAVAGFLARLGYPTDRREELNAAAFGLPPETADAIRKMELLAEDDERFFRVIFVQLRSITAKARNELARNLGGRNADHLLILTKDFDVLEFVLIDKETRQRHAPGGGPSVRVIPRVVTVMRKASTHLDRRVLRRLTWTGKDGLDQFDKLRSVFEAAHYSGQYFQNRALFADHYLETRLREDAAWRDDPSTTFAAVRDLLSNARGRWGGKPEEAVRGELFEPLWKLLGFKAKVAKAANKDHLTPDYELHGADDKSLTVAFCYRWDRWLDGPDLNDPETPEENPGAAVVSALADGRARWIIVTNGKYWRLYSRDAHSRSTNFYEVDLEEALLASGETDPNEAFRYWWLFFRRPAFETLPQTDPPTCWLDTIVRGSRDYAKRLGDRLKDRIFVEIFPHLAQGFLLDRKKRLGLSRAPSDDELRDTFEATLTLLYRLLFLLYAESRDLLPVREAAYKAASLKQIKEEIAEHAGVAESEAASKLKAYSDAEATIYDRLTRLFAVMDQGDVVLNVPCYNGGLFLTQPDRQSIEREHRIARFLLEHKVPDRHLASAIDRLARDVDDKTFSLSFIDYKSLEVRHLGSIYEGLLEFKLKIAGEDLGVTTEKKAEKYIPLAQVRPGRGKRAAAGAVVSKGEVYLSNDKAERKATGSYYTPDPIVEYIVEHTVGPVLAEKLDALRPDLNAAGKTYHRHLTNAKNNPGLVPKDADPRAFAAAKTYAEHRDLVDRVFDLKVLDPAMGSGHFLVEAVDFITDRLLDFLNRFPHNPVQFALDKTRRSILDALGEQGVTVDPDKLTDVNLLKRHVLKRCIYGVDLNPMAVELAKVSLWLDAFTLGAPLSFLDHHLRCGNSLIGATFEDLKKATTGQLFAIDYEPLLRAIRHVLFVNEMADATAAEVHKSADEYSHARRELSGYQIVLDLLVADHFVDGKLKPSKLLQEASDLDLTTRAKLLASLDEKAALLVEQVENVARRPDLRFFHWEIEFPEAFFGFADADRRQIKHRNDIAAGSAGFDAVVGNPPYGPLAVEIREFVSEHFNTEGGKPEVYAFFIERATNLLRNPGAFAFITPNTWLTLKAFRKLRKYTLEQLRVTAILDTLGVFPDAWVNTVVVVCKRQDTLDTEHETQVLIPRRSATHQEQLRNIAHQQWAVTYSIRQQTWLEADDAAIAYTTEPFAQNIIDRIRNRFVPLRELFSVTTGYQVYHNTRHTAEQIRDRCFHTTRPARSAGYKRCFGGTDVRRYSWDYSSDEYVLFGDNIYRSPDASFFTQPKVLVQEIFGRGRYKVSAAFAKEPVYYDKSCLGIIGKCVAGDDDRDLLTLVGVLNSFYVTWYFIVAGNKVYGTGDFARLTKQDLADLPIPRFKDDASDQRLVSQFDQAASAGRTDEAFALVAPLLRLPPFPATARDCMTRLVKRIIDIESARGEIARAERSALDPKAQPLQDLFDHMSYHMAGLTDADIEGLEERLARML